MNQIASTNERLPMDSVSISTGSTGAKIAPQNLAEVVKFAEVMCRADIALPKHLRGNAGACMAVSLQALDWQMNPFAVASKSYTVNGAIAYEAQLIAAVVNTRSGIKGRLRYHYTGEGDKMTCTVIGMLDGDECEYTTPPIGSITTKNSPLWKSDPQQQLGYFAARSWARRHCPEVILGVYDRDEAEEFRGPDNARDITPGQPSVLDRLKERKAATTTTEQQEGFDSSFVQSETESVLTGEVVTGNKDDTPAVESKASDTFSQGATSEVGNSSASFENEILIRYARDILPKAADTNIPPATLSAIEKRWAGAELLQLSDEGREKARAISASMRKIANDPAMLEGILEHYAEMLDCKQEQIGGAG